MPPPSNIQNLVFSYRSALGAAQNVASFGGTGSIFLTSASFPTTATTIEFWIASTQTAAGAVIMSYDDQATGQPNRLWIKNPSNLQVGFGSHATAATGISVADGLWHHVAVIVTPSTQVTIGVFLYIDGAIAWGAAGAIARTAGAWPDASADLQLGTGITGETGLNGQLSEFRIWNQALTATQIVNTMGQRLTTATPGVVLDWPLTQIPPSATASGVTFPLGSPVMRFVTSETLSATWDTAGAGYTYNVSVTGGVDWIAPQTGVSTNSATITGFDLNTYYTLNVSAVSGITVGPAITANVSTINLNPPLQPYATSPATGTVTAKWNAVDLATAYTVVLTPTGGGNPVTIPASSTSADISSQALSTSGWTYVVQAALGTITGPASLITTVTAAPSVALSYVQDAAPPGTMNAALGSTDSSMPYLLAVTQVGQPGEVVTPVLAAGTTSYVVGPVTPNTSSPQQYSATARAVPSGAIGPLSTASVITVLDIAGPVISAVTADAGTNTVTVTFQGSGGGTFIAQLLNGSGQLITQADPATSPQNLQSTQVIDGASLQVRVRAVQGGCYGRWSALSSIVVGAPAQVQGVSAQSDSSDNITVNWTSLGSGITYKVQLYDSQNTCIYTVPSVSGTSTNMLESDTHVAEGQTYTVTVTGISSTGLVGPASTPATVTTPTKPTVRTTGDPVSIISGQYVYSSDDIVVNAVIPLIFTTRYSGAWQTHAENPLIPVSSMGNRWTHSYMTRIVQSGGYNYVLWANGQMEIFQIPPSYSGTQIPAGVLPGSTLVIATSGAFTLTRADKTTYSFLSNGLLNMLSDHFGNTVQLAYSGTQLSTVTDVATGLAFRIAYQNGYVHTVTDPLNRTVTYSQNGSGDLLGMTDPCSNQRTFSYQGISLMQYAVDGNGNKVFQNTYTNSVISSQQSANALKSGSAAAQSFNYQNSTSGGVAVVVCSGTDAAGNNYSYTSSSANGVCLQNSLSLSSGQVFIQTNIYDGYNNLTSQTTYSGPTSGYTQGTGNTTTYTYDGNGNCLTEITTLSATNVYAISRTFDANSNMLTQSIYEGLLSSWSPGKGNSWTYTYYSNNALHTVTNPLGGVQTLIYASNAQPHTVTDILGNTTTYTYTNAILTSVANTLGETTTITPDAIGRPHITTYQGLSGGVLATVTLGFNANSQILTRTVAYPSQSTGYLTTLTYDGNGNLKTETDPSGNLTTYGHMASNDLQSITYAPVSSVSRQIIYAYDNLGNPLSTTLTSTASHPLSIVTGYTCNAQGQVTTATDPNGFVYTYTNQMAPGTAGPFPTVSATLWPLLASQTQHASQTTTYDPLGRPTAMTDRNGNTIAIAYTTQTDGVTNTTQSIATVTYPATASQAATTQIAVLDAMGRLYSTTDQLNHVTGYAYDVTSGPNNSKALQVTATDPNGNTNVLTYDQSNRLIGTLTGTAQNNRSTSFTYDCLGRILSQTTTQGTTSTQTTYLYGFDNTSNCWTVTVGRPGMTTGATVQYYNGLNQLVKQVAPFGATVSYSYTPWGAIASYTNGRGQTLTYQFDDAGRLKQTTPPSGSPIVYTLDNNGNRQSIAMGSQTVGYTWDNWNRKLTRTGVEGAAIGYQYWPGDQLKTLTYSDNKTVSYNIDALGRLITVTDWNTPTANVVTYGYTLTNQLSSIAYPNGASSAYGYDPGDRLTKILHMTNGLVIGQWSPLYDPIGQLSTATVINPLVPTAPGSNTTITYANNNQINQINGSNAAYDGDGNYTGISATSPVVVYDVFGRVTSSSLASVSAASFTYDPDGLRTQAVSASVTSNYVFDVNGFQSPMVERADPARALAYSTTAPTLFSVQSPYPTYTQLGPAPVNDAVDRILEVRDQSQTIQTRYVYGLGLISQQNASGAGRYFHGDVAGNLWALTDMTSGAVTDAAIFSPYGQTYAQSGATTIPFRYAGLFGVMNDGSGLLYMRARSYSPAQMRFLQPDYVLGDPLNPQSFNQYGYTCGNPVQWSDPLGLDSWPTWKKVALGLGIGAAAAGGLWFVNWATGGAISSFFSGLFGRGGGGDGGNDSGSDNGSDQQGYPMRPMGSGGTYLTSAGRAAARAAQSEAQYGRLGQVGRSVSSRTPGWFQSIRLWWARL